MKIFSVLIALFLIGCATPRYNSAVELQEVAIEYKNFFPGGVNPLITENGLGKNLDKELNLHLNTDLFGSFYWNNMVHSMTDKDNEGHGQFRLIGWNFKLGIYLTNYIDFGYDHFSRHFLDYAGPPGWRFPVQDSVYIKIYLYRPNNVNKGLIPF